MTNSNLEQSAFIRMDALNMQTLRVAAVSKANSCICKIESDLLVFFNNARVRKQLPDGILSTTCRKPATKTTPTIKLREAHSAFALAIIPLYGEFRPAHERQPAYF